MRFTLLAVLLVLFVMPLSVYSWLQFVRPAAEGKVKLRYMAWGSPERRTAEQSLLARFMELHPEMQVDFIVAPGDGYMQKLQLMLASRTEPDVYRLLGSAYPQYAALGYFADLQPFIDVDPNFRLSDFVPQAVAETYFQGRILSLECVFGGRVLYYNKSMFAAAGLQDPFELYQKGQWTYDQFLADAKAMTKTSPTTGMPTQFGLYLDHVDIHWIVWGFGGEIFRTSDQTVHVDDPESIQGMQFYSDLEHKYHVVPMPSQAGLHQYNFESGNVGLWPDWVGAAARFRVIKSFEWDIVPLPAGPAGRTSMAGGNATVMSHITAHPKESWELMKFLSSVEAEKTFCGDRYRRCIPTNLSVMKSDAFLHAAQPPFNTTAYLALYGKTKPVPATANSNAWSPDFSRWMDRMMTDEPSRAVDPITAAKGMARDIRATIAKPEDE